MKIETRHFGMIEIDESKIIDFPEGIPAFEDVKKFVLLGTAEENMPFQWLQGVDDPMLAFVVIDPRVFKPEYVVDVDDAEVDILNVKDTKNVLIYSIVVVPEDIKKMTANLKAPILINTENNKGKQVTLDTGEYSIRQLIFESLQQTGVQK